MTDQAPSTILNRAADLIEHDGWWQDGASLPSPSRPSWCVYTAVLATCRGIYRLDGGVPSETTYATIRAVMGYLGVGYLDEIWLWNDTPGRTKGEAVAMLRACAAVQQAREEVRSDVKPREPDTAFPVPTHAPVLSSEGPPVTTAGVTPHGLKPVKQLVDA